MVASGHVKKGVPVDTALWTELLLLPGARLMRRVVIITRLLLGYLGTRYRLGCVAGTVAALHPILLTTSEVRGVVVHFIHWH